jgi:gliding motility-associated-like protein
MVRRILNCSCKKFIWVVLSILWAAAPAYSQSGCVNVPSFSIDLTGNPNGTWVSPPVIRANQCCGLSNPERCVEFIITLDPATEALSLDIISGAVPGGALFYQINCGPQNPLSQAVCISGVGPHYVTFCKPGNNENVYEISAIGQPELSDDLTLNDGCAGEIFVSGLDPASINWTTVAPGNPGEYNHLLSCTSGCTNIQVQSQGNPPPYIDVEVSGNAIGNCSGISFRDTVRIHFVPALFAEIAPQNAYVCFGQPGIEITANANGGTAPYNFLWSTGATSQSIIAQPGTYWVQLSDASGCPPVFDTIEVFGFDSPIMVNAGININLCVADNSVTLNGQVQGASGGIWLNGSGSFNPDNQSLNSIYTPSQSEIDNGMAVLILESTGNGTCPPDRDTLIINIFNVLTENYNPVICQGDVFSVHGFSYNAPGVYNETLSYANGCDSIVFTVDLTVLDVVFENYNPVICQGDVFTVHGFSYNASGVYNETLPYANGCDSIVFTVDLTVLDVAVENYNPVICQGDVFSVYGFSYNAPGVYNETLSYANGCDSIVFTVDLTVLDVVVENYNPVICQGDVFSIYGFSYNAPGVYNETLSYANGCDSIVFTVDLTVLDVAVENYNPVICQGDVFSVHGFSFNASGVYNETLPYANGCDSIVFTVNLTVLDVAVENYNPVICQGDVFTVHGFSYNASGVYNETLPYANGCDSIVFTVDLTVLDVVIENYNPVICQGDVFTVHGFSYNASGVYNETLPYANGCDSIVFTVDLTVFDVAVENYNPVICQGDVFSVHGFSYNASGVYNETLPYANGCDSIVFTVNLTVLDVAVENYNPVICQGDVFSIHGFSFNASGVYYETLSYANGCDSIIFTVDLTVNPTFSSSEEITICSNEFYTLPNGNMVNTAGVYQSHFLSASGCDSVITSTVNVNMLGNHEPLNDLVLCESGNFSLNIEAQNMQSYLWEMYVPELGFIDLEGNPNFIGAGSERLSFYLNTFLHDRDFRVTMTDFCGNIYQESMNLKVFEPLPIENKPDDLYFCEHEIEVVTVGYNGFNFMWNDGTIGRSILPEKSGEYIVSFNQFETGCQVSDTIFIEVEDCIERCVVLAPTGFTPDGNGVNDIFRVVTSCDEGFSYFRLYVHNRWGELVYQTENPRDGWDGNYKGRTAEIGVYTFYVEYSKNYSARNEMIKGNVTLIR